MSKASRLSFRYLLMLATTLFGVFALTACSVDAQEPSVSDNQASEAEVVSIHRITPEETLDALKDSTVVLLDVRTPEEYEDAHIEGAHLLPVTEIDAAAASATIADYDTEVIVYCRSGARSADAANKLIELGYTNISDLGGILSWPYETVSGMNS